MSNLSMSQPRSTDWLFVMLRWLRWIGTASLDLLISFSAGDVVLQKKENKKGFIAASDACLDVCRTSHQHDKSTKNNEDTTQ